MLNVFELLGINKNATSEDIQLSFAYLYQMIDLIYPLEGDGGVGKDRFEELKKLEFAYLSALKSIRTEVIRSSNPNYQKKSNTISELDKIEKLLNQNNRNSKLEESFIKEYKYPIFKINGRHHKILELSELEISISPSIFHSCGETLKGELKLTPETNLKIVGKIVRKEKDRVITKLVTRIAKKWVKEFNTKKITKNL